MRNFNDFNESIGAKLIFVSNVYDENGVAIPISEQKPQFVHCVEDFSTDESNEVATLKNGIFDARTAITGISMTGSFTAKSFDPQVLAILKGLKLSKGSTIVDSTAVSATIPSNGELAITLEAGTSLVSLLNVVGEDGSIFKRVNTVAPGAGEYSVDFVNSELVFNVADANKKVAITRMYSDANKGVSYELNATGNIGDASTRRGVRLVVLTPFSQEVEVFENVNFNSISTSASNTEYKSATFNFTAGASPISGKIYSQSFKNAFF